MMTTARDVVGADLIAAALESRREDLISIAVDAIQSRMPAYRQADPALLEDVRRHIGEHHDLLCTVLRRGGPADPGEFEFVRRHAAMRARRAISLPDFLERIAEKTGCDLRRLSDVIDLLIAVRLTDAGSR